VGWVLTGAKADEREALQTILNATPAWAMAREHRQSLLADKNYFGKLFQADLADADIDLLRGTRKGEKPRPGQRFLKPLRRVIESANDTLKHQLDLEAHGGLHLEAHGGRSGAGVCARITQRVSR